jgi:hypothetical protein
MPCEFHDTQGGAPVELAHDPRRSFIAMGPGQIQWSPLASQGHGGHGQGGHALSCNAQGRRAQPAGGAGRPRQVPVPTPGLEPQACQLALHIHLWLDHMEAFPKGSASSKRVTSDQGGPGAASNG